MAESTVRRSWSVFATNRCTMPAPKSKPSRTTYTVNIRAMITNHAVAPPSLLRGLRGRSVRHRPARDLTPDEIEEQDAEHEVQPHVTQRREGDVAAAHVGRGAVHRP